MSVSRSSDVAVGVVEAEAVALVVGIQVGVAMAEAVVVLVGIIVVEGLPHAPRTIDDRQRESLHSLDRSHHRYLQFYGKTRRAM